MNLPNKLTMLRIILIPVFLVLVLVVALLIMEPHMSGIVLTTAMVGTILLYRYAGWAHCPQPGPGDRLWQADGPAG